jgi:hypothetical protein
MGLRMGMGMGCGRWMGSAAAASLPRFWIVDGTGASKEGEMGDWGASTHHKHTHRGKPRKTSQSSQSTTTITTVTTTTNNE